MMLNQMREHKMSLIKTVQVKGKSLNPGDSININEQSYKIDAIAEHQISGFVLADVSSESVGDRSITLCSETSYAVFI